MLYIEGHWEEVDTLRDISRVIREYYNNELADRTDELVDEFVGMVNDNIKQLEEQIDNFKYNDF